MDAFACLKDNLLALEKTAPEFAAWFREHKDSWSGWKDQVFFNARGWLDISLSGKKTLLETIPPQAYYSDWKPELSGVKGASIISGCNLGYGINALLGRTAPGHKIAVTDPSPQMLALCLGVTDYRQLLLQGRLVFFPPYKQAQEDILLGMNLQFYHGGVYFWADTPSMQIGPEYERLNLQCRDVLQKYKVQTGTLRRRQDAIVANELDNYGRAFEDGSLGDVQGFMKDKSALVLGAGPSLEKFGPDLAESASNKAVLAAGLQTLPALARLGIKPHVCMAIDFTSALLNPLERLDKKWLRDIPFVYSTKVHPEVVRRYPGPRAAMWTRGGLGTLVFKNRGILLDTGGSVNVALVRLFLEMGVKRIVFAGMDFGWKGESSHAPGHHAAELRRGKGVKGVEARKNADQEIVYSTPSYLTSLWELEKTVALHPDVDFGNLFGGYMDIQGVPRLEVQDLIKSLGSDDSGQDSHPGGLCLWAFKDSSRPVFEKRGGQWSSSLRRAEKRLERLFSRPEKNREDIRRTLAEIRMFVSQDPLYLTYLQPEIMDISALEKFNVQYFPADLVRLKQIVQHILKKVRHVDRTAGNSGLSGAA
ncbi:MAG: motility associated factor glycosyltransferase family protein [Desulfonatronovibrionaceae bacterium]